MKEKTLDAFKNQEYPFEDLVEKLGVRRDTSRNPLFDVMFVLQNLDVQTTGNPGAAVSSPPASEFESRFNIEHYGFPGSNSKFDLTLFAEEENDGLSFSMEYSTALFNAAAIEKFIAYFKEIAASASLNPGKACW